MNNSNTVFRFAPDIYENNETMLAVYNSQSIEINNYTAIIQRVFLNNLVKYCDLEGIRRFEALFYIQADEENETLDYRKARIIQKFTIQLPYTKIFLRNMLNEIFGEENIDIDIAYNDYELRIGIENVEQAIIDETFRQLRQEFVPANIGLTPMVYEPYMHRYLKKYYTHEQMAELTQGELSQYA